MSDFHDLYHVIIEELDNYADNDNIIKDITDKLNSTDLFNQNERLKNKIIKYLNILRNNENNFFGNVEKLAGELGTKVKLNKEQAENVAVELEDILDPKTVKTLIGYLEDRDTTGGLDIDNYCGNKTTFKDLFDAAGLKEEQDKLIPYLLNKRFHTYPVTGKGELLFSFVFSDARRPGGKKDKEAGDVMVGENPGKKMEVKGEGGRLGGQSGYGKGFTVAKTFKTAFLDMGPDDPEKRQEFVKDVKASPNSSFNFNTKQLKNQANAFLTLCNKVAENDATFSLDKAKQIMEEGFSQLYTDETAFKEALEAYNFINHLKETTGESDGKPVKTFSIDKPENFFQTTLLFGVYYYYLLENFTYFAVFNDTSFIIFNFADFTPSGGGQSFNEVETKILGTLNFRNSAFGDNDGEMGGKISVSLKAK